MTDRRAEKEVAVAAGRSGPLHVWYGGVCLAVVFVSQVALAIVRTPLAPRLLAAGLCIPLLIVGRRTGLFIDGGQLRLRMGGVQLWTLSLMDDTERPSSG